MRHRCVALIAFLSILSLAGFVGCGFVGGDPVAPSPPVSPRTPPPEINLVAVQMRVDESMFTSGDTFEAGLRSMMDLASEETELGSDTLVVFPEDIGLLTVLFGQGDTLSTARGLEDGMEKVIRSNLVSVGKNKLFHRVSWPRALFLTFGEGMAEAYFETFSTLAREYGVYIVGGSVALSDASMSPYVPDGIPGAPGEKERRNSADVYNAGAVFGPGGEVLGVTRKANLIELEGPGGLDLVPGDVEAVQPIPTSLGSIGLAICLDGFSPGVLDALGEADILAQPSANPVEWERWQQEEWLESSWTAVVQERRFPYAVNPMLTGNILDLSFFGQSSIVVSDASREESVRGFKDLDDMPGFAAVASDDFEGEVISVRVPHPDHR